jgi:hypothetical protein
LILTQYWALFLIVAAVGLCLWKRHWRLFAAIAAGGVLFLPWLPSFLYQSAHTGAPWGARADLGVYEISVRGFAGGPGRLGALGMTYLLLAVLAVVGRPGEDGSVVLDVRGTVQGRRLAMAAIVPLSLAMALSYATKAAFAVRYSAIVLVPFVFLVVHGLELVRPAYAMRWVLAFALVFAVVRSGVEAHMQRTQAVQVAHVLNAQAKPGDLVVFCPDQLGPAVTRLLHAPVTTSAYPAGDSGQVVDWVDYQARNKAAQPGAFAERAVAQAPSGAVWVVFANGYRTFGASCANLWDRLDDLRPGAKRLVKPLKKSIEKASLWRFSAPSRGNP